MEEDSKSQADHIAKALKSITKQPEAFLTAQLEKRPDILDLIQNLYQLAFRSNADAKISTEILPELVVQDMDAEQIWQQIEIRNNHVIRKYIESTSKLIAINEEKLEIRLNEENENDAHSDNEQDDEDSADDEQVEEEAVDANDFEDASNDGDTLQASNTKKDSKKKRKSIVDDEFFKLDEMEAFLEAEEAKEKRKLNSKLMDDDGIDYFDENLGDAEMNDETDDSDEEDANRENPNYKDFFDTTADNTETANNEEPASKSGKSKSFKKKVEQNEIEDEANVLDGNENESDRDDAEETSFNRNTLQPASDSDSQSDDSSEDKPKSSFQQRQERLEQRIRDYEAEVLGEKPWQMKGEVQAGTRPKNSLLEEILEFDSTVRPAPVITEETTRCLEDIIRQRIKDQAWDDVVRVVKPVHTPQEYRKQLVLDQEKSKESLAQIYEKEYQREMDKLKPQADEPDEPMLKEHQEIRNMMHTLFIKLDALSNFHFTPKPVAPEAKIITNTQALNMEEVAPVAVSDANLLAPEEIYRGPKHLLLGKTERTRTDKNRELRKKKQKQRAIHKALEAKDERRQKLGIPLGKQQENAKLLKQITRNRNVDKVKASTDHAALKSSKAFFTKLQDNSNQLVNSKAKATKKKADAQGVTAKKLKL